MKKVFISKMAKGTQSELFEDLFEEKIVAENLDDEKILKQIEIDNLVQKTADEIAALIEECEHKTGQKRFRIKYNPKVPEERVVTYSTQNEVCEKIRVVNQLEAVKRMDIQNMDGTLRGRVRKIGYLIGRNWNFETACTFQKWAEDSFIDGFERGKRERGNILG